MDRLEGLIKPDQMTANAISGQIARASAAPTAVYAVSYADFLAAPSIPNAPEHIRSQEGWASRESGVGLRRPLSFRRWILAYLRYALSVHMCGGWCKFGGFSDQLDFISVALRLDVVGNPGAALIYARLVAARIEKMERDRDTSADCADPLRSEPTEIRANAVRENASGTEDVDKKEEGGKKKKEDGRESLPRRCVAKRPAAAALPPI